MLRLVIALTIFSGCAATNTGRREATYMSPCATMAGREQQSCLLHGPAPTPQTNDGSWREVVRVISAGLSGFAGANRPQPVYHPVEVPTHKPPMRMECRPGIAPDTVHCEEVRY